MDKENIMSESVVSDFLRVGLLVAVIGLAMNLYFNSHDTSQHRDRDAD